MQHTSLTGKLLLAMPNMGDPRFHRAVILICAHDVNGAMGLVVNHILPGIDLRHLLEQLHILPLDSEMLREPYTPVLSGGPMEHGRGFILHSPDFQQKDTIAINDDIAVTGTVDALRAVAVGAGPQDMLFVLGYSGWESGQLDREMQENAWLVSEASADLLFRVEPDDKWQDAIRRMGVDPAMLSGAAGRA